VESLKKFRQFLSDTWKELKRTSWPSKDEVVGTTIVVIVFVAIVAAWLGAVDFVLALVQKHVLGLGAGS